MEYDTIILGAGVAGLAAAVKLSKEGKKVLVLDRQLIPGGLATTFKRKGYTFESSIHCVDSLAEDGDVGEFLKEYGVKFDCIELSSFARMSYPEHNFILDFNRDNFLGFLQESFPEEKNNLIRFFKALDRFYKELDRFDESKLPEWLDIALAFILYPRMVKVSTQTTQQLIEGFTKDKKLQAIITGIWPFLGLAPSRLSALYFLNVFRGYYYNKTVHVKGGFLNLFKAMTEAICGNGSEVLFGATVKSVKRDDDTGRYLVLTQDQKEYRARSIVSNINPEDLFTKLINDHLVHKKYTGKLSQMEYSLSATQLYLGLNVPLSELEIKDHLVFNYKTYDFDDAYVRCLRGDYDSCPIIITNHTNIDPSYAPSGKTSIMITVLDSYSNWDSLDRVAYERKKEKVAEVLIRRVQEFIPDINKYIEIKEVATPKTIERYGVSIKGAIYGYSQTVGQSGIMRLGQRTSLKGLFLAGAWVRPGGGVHGCFVSGKSAADLVLSFLKE